MLTAVALFASIALLPSPPVQSTGLLRSRLMAPADPVGFYKTVQEANTHFGANRYAEAVPLYERAIQDYPLDGDLWVRLGFSLALSGKPKESIAPFNKGMELTSTWQDFVVLRYMAYAYMDMKDKEGALKTLEKMVYETPFVRRPDLYEDPRFKDLQNEPRFLKMVGRMDTSKMSRTEGWRKDIDFIHDELKRVNHKYKVQPLPKAFMDRYSTLKKDVPKLTDDQLFVRLGHMLAPLKQAHISLALFPETKLSPARTLPLVLYAFPDGVHVIGVSDPKFSDWVGSKIVKVQGVPAEDVLKRLEEHKSVENPMKQMWGGGDITNLQPLRGIGVVPKDATAFTFTVEKDGKSQERTLESGSYQHPRKTPAPQGVTAPMFLKNTARQHWFEKMPEVADTLFVQFNQVSPAPDETVPAFGLRLRKYLVDNPTKNIILDVRHNNGGNTATYPELLRTLVAHSIGEGKRLYVLIGRQVYSATGNFVVDLERLAAPIFVGEPTSGFGNQDGDESFIILPYSGVRGWIASVWWQYSHPWDRRTSMQPDVPVQMTAADYFAGRDPVLDTVVEMIRKGS